MPDLIYLNQSIPFGDVNNSPQARHDYFKHRTEAHFLEFWVPCKRGKFMNYLSNAHGNVLLQSGKRISVSNSIDKPLAILCDPKAK